MPNYCEKSRKKIIKEKGRGGVELLIYHKNISYKALIAHIQLHISKIFICHRLREAAKKNSSTNGQAIKRGGGQRPGH